MRILDAAQTLFAKRGYASSTVEAIAAVAGVAVDTVYAAFGSKRGVLQALLNVRVGGDEAELDLLARVGPQAVQREPDQMAQLAAFAAEVSAIIERARPVDDIMRGAAAVDADIATLRSEAQAYRYRNMRQLVSWLAAKGPLRETLSEDDAAAIMWTITSPEVHGLLRVARGWSAERYAAWLAQTLARTLLP
ncbi:MAG TPA: TetR family transcriptional regulator [Candidatus Dormibacteraeota bacterium]